VRAQTPAELVEAIEQNLDLDAKLSESAAFECVRKLAYSEANRLRRTAQRIREVRREISERRSRPGGD